jgi:hypothetical protein
MSNSIDYFQFILVANENCILISEVYSEILPPQEVARLLRDAKTSPFAPEIFQLALEDSEWFRQRANRETADFCRRLIEDAYQSVLAAALNLAESGKPGKEEFFFN